MVGGARVFRDRAPELDLEFRHDFVAAFVGRGCFSTRARVGWRALPSAGSRNRHSQTFGAKAIADAKA